MFEQMDPKTLVKWLILAAIVYLIVPFDAIPDFFGIAGRIDDLAVMVALAWMYRNHVKRWVATQAEGAAADAGAGAHRQQSPGARPQPAESRDPYTVLGIDRGASKEAIRDAYRARMREYHPDKVAHLGEALQQLAHEKSQEIQKAYRVLGG